MGDDHDGWMQFFGVDVNKFAEAKKQVDATLAKKEKELQSSLQSAQDSGLAALGVSPETAQKIKEAQQAGADFEKGREKGRAEGSMGLINALPPVQLAKAVNRIANAKDKEAEAIQIAREKAATVGAVGKAIIDPVGTGEKMGKQAKEDILKAKKEGHLAESAGNVAGHAD